MIRAIAAATDNCCDPSSSTSNGSLVNNHNYSSSSSSSNSGKKKMAPRAPSSRTTSECQANSGVRRVVVVGSGTMGAGIAQASLVAGCQTTILIRDATRIDAVRKKVLDGAERYLKRKGLELTKETTLALACNQIDSDEAEQKLSVADLVIESIRENLDEKRALFERLERIVSRDCLLVSNTSSLSLADISSRLQDSSRFAGLHFFSPVSAMQLVEVAQVDDLTSPETMRRLSAFTEQLGKAPLECRDTPGFVVNRLMLPFLLDAMRMLERGDATREQIDRAMKLGARHPLGPLELADSIGLDVLEAVVEGWHGRFPDEAAFRPVAILQRLVGEGKLGRKAGAGFYDYPAPK